jgi:hypothetical protein
MVDQDVQKFESRRKSSHANAREGRLARDASHHGHIRTMMAVAEIGSPFIQIQARASTLALPTTEIIILSALIPRGM